MERSPITVQRVDADEPVDVHAWARQLVATVLALDSAPVVLPIRRAS